MKQLKQALVLLVFGVACAALGVLVGSGAGVIAKAFADQDYLPSGASANYSRACSFEGKTAQAVAVTSTAAASSATGIGVVRLYCTQAAHFVQWVSGVTGATATTGSTIIGPAAPEYVLSGGGKFSLVRDAADGTCFITDCK